MPERLVAPVGPPVEFRGVSPRRASWENWTGLRRTPKSWGGKACIRGMRVTVGMIVGQIGAGRRIDDLLADYPYLEREDVFQALRYAAWRAEGREVVLTGG
jgi:uncharacterized protein (DUF433 family)